MNLSDIKKATKGKVKTTGVSDFMELEIDLVYANPYQPRKFFDEEKLQELASSIAQNGLLQPIVVKKTDFRYMIIAGERRYKAHLLNNSKTIKCFINNVNYSKVKIQSLLENIQRDDLTDFEVANYITVLWNDGEFEKKQDLANALGKKPAYISKALGLIDKLDETIKDDLVKENSDIGLSVLEEISRIEDKNTQKDVYEKIKNKEITRNEIKNYKEKNIKGKSFTKTDLNNFKQKELPIQKQKVSSNKTPTLAFESNNVFQDALDNTHFQCNGNIKIEIKLGKDYFKSNKNYKIRIEEL
jgi:ParB family chromosome partitioning protein